MSFAVTMSNFPKWVTEFDIHSWLAAEDLTPQSVKIERKHVAGALVSCALIELQTLNDMEIVIRRFDRAPLENYLLRATAVAPRFDDSAEAASEVPRSRERIPDSVKMFVWRRDGGRCVECGGKERLEFDHIIPFAEGGSDTERNLQLLCEACNRRKGSRI